MKKSEVTILMVDDDLDDIMLVSDAFSRIETGIDFRSVKNGRELLDYLRRKEKRPDLILLDLNMPLMNGRETLREIKATTDFQYIPVVVFTTSADEKTISDCYCLGASAYIVKPAGFEELTETARSISKFWFQVAKLPPLSVKC